MYNEIKKYSARDIYPFHMPGHKRNADFLPPFSPESLDLSEIPGMDMLSVPSGIIKAFREKIAKIYGAGESFFLTNGASAGVVAAVCATACENTPIFVPRNAHVSLYNGLVFSGARPNYFLPETTSCGLAGGVSPDKFDNLPRGSVVFIVSPTYEGFVSDIAAIAEKVHAAGGLLVVDEAHGAHFAFHDFFPQSAVKAGADIVINSLHKTLPAISGCAVLHVRKGLELPRIGFFVNAMQTTSPSYFLMAACDFMLDRLSPGLFEKYVQRLTDFRHGAPGIIGREMVGNSEIFDIDEGKLLFSVNNVEEVSEILAREYKVQLEMAKGRHILAMTSVADTDEGFSRLFAALPLFGRGHECGAACALEAGYATGAFALPEIVLTPREAMRRESEEIPAEEAVGRISAGLVADYPPGIAIIAPGERIHKRVNKPSIRVVKQEEAQW